MISWKEAEPGAALLLSFFLSLVLSLSYSPFNRNLGRAEADLLALEEKAQTLYLCFFADKEEGETSALSNRRQGDVE